MQRTQPALFRQDTDPTLIQFLHEKIHTFVQWDVLQYLHHNPHTMDTPGQIARALGRDRTSVAVALLALEEVKIVQSRDVGETIYMLTDDSADRTLIQRFIRACDDSRFRRSVIETLAQSTPVVR